MQLLLFAITSLCTGLSPIKIGLTSPEQLYPEFKIVFEHAIKNLQSQNIDVIASTKDTTPIAKPRHDQFMYKYHM